MPVERNQQTADDIKAMIELITPEDAWTKGALARDKDGAVANVGGPDAVCFCVLGARERVVPYQADRYQAIREAIVHYVPDDRIGRFNDTHTHQEVLDVLKQAWFDVLPITETVTTVVTEPPTEPPNA